jgi:hypothetical protein
MRGLENIEGMNLTKKADFSKYIQSSPASNDVESPFYRWEATLNIETEKESAYGKLKSIQVQERNKAGYIIKLLMVYENQEITLTKENDIRKAIGLYLSETVLSNGEIRTNLSMIPSACFEVAESSEGKIILRGGGYGHAIGLSQYGADKLGKDGKTYEEMFNLPSIGKDLNEETINALKNVTSGVPPVIGPTPNLIGCLEAFEAYKIITGVGKVTVAPNILTFDLLDLGSFSLDEL